MAIHYYPYVNKVFTHLQLRDKIIARYLTESPDNFARPFITFAREPGSGGHPIAEAVAKKLGFSLIDDQIVESIANSTRRRRSIIRQVDEKARSVIGEMVHSLLNEEYIDDVSYITEMAKAVLTYAYQGNVVLVGRGSNFLTPFSKGLHVYVTAPYEVRVDRAMEFEGHTRVEAKKIIRQVDKDRSDFVKKFLSKDIDKKNSYDLTINTTSFNIKQAREIVLEAFYQKFPRMVRYGALLK